MKPISKHKSVHYAKTLRQIELEQFYRFTRLEQRIIKDIICFIKAGKSLNDAHGLVTMAKENAFFKTIKLYGNR